MVIGLQRMTRVSSEREAELLMQWVATRIPFVQGVGYRKLGPVEKVIDHNITIPPSECNWGVFYSVENADVIEQAIRSVKKLETSLGPLLIAGMTTMGREELVKVLEEEFKMSTAVAGKTATSMINARNKTQPVITKDKGTVVGNTDSSKD